MISVTDKQYRAVNDRYFIAFGEDIPLMMVPDGETVESLTEKVDKSIKEGRNLLPEIYGWDEEDKLY